jgi:hypothetical protein
VAVAALVMVTQEVLVVLGVLDQLQTELMVLQDYLLMELDGLLGALVEHHQ